MARYYRRRYTRVVKPKKKWASNIRAINMGGSIQSDSVEKIAHLQELCVNSSEVSSSSVITSPTPVVLKTGNFKVQVDCVYSANIPATLTPTVEIFIYIMYLPEGVGIETGTAGIDYDTLNGLVMKHPEWILAWRHLGADSAITSGSPTNVERVQFSSRLKRNLNSGDRVCALLVGHTHHSTAYIKRLECHGMVQFWTCAN